MQTYRLFVTIGFIGIFSSIITFISPAQTWDQIIKATASDRMENDNFGYCVCISGDYAIVGAPYESEDALGGNTMDYAGSAYIFIRSGNSWIQQQKIVSSDRSSYDSFGYSVSISGNYAIVGAYAENEDTSGENSFSSAGSAYIFVRNGSTWTQVQKLVASDRAAYDYFGVSVSISGNYALVGAYTEDDDAAGENPLNSAGSAYMFFYDGSHWIQQQKIVGSDRAENDQFGSTVAISGDYAIIGAPNESEDALGENTLLAAGSAYMYVRNGSNWEQQQKIVATDRGAEDCFGNSVSISGDYAVIGAFYEDEDAEGANTMDYAGSAYIFLRNGIAWNQEQKLVASDRAVDDCFGSSVSISGDRVIVSAFNECEDADGTNMMDDAGSAYIFVRTGTEWNQQQKLVASDRAEYDLFGNSVAIAGEYAIIGAYYEAEDAGGANTLPYAGSAYIFGPGSVTPVELSSISASSQISSITLQWKTATEINNYGFEIERRNVNSEQQTGNEWHKIGFVRGSGTSNAPQSYSYIDAGLSAGAYIYRLKQIDHNGTFQYSKSVEVCVLAPDQFMMKQNYPNPFNPTTSIAYQIPVSGFVSLKIYDILGKEVATLVQEMKDAGSYAATWDASELSSGIYFYRITAGRFSSIKKMILMK